MFLWQNPKNNERVLDDSPFRRLVMISAKESNLARSEFFEKKRSQKVKKSFCSLLPHKKGNVNVPLITYYKEIQDLAQKIVIE